MTLKRILTVSLILLLLPAFSLAQGPNSGSITITSNPSGAYVTIIGDVTVTGITPVSFDQLMAGKYKIVASSPGYENYTNSIIIDPTKETVVDVTLNPKTKSKAALRSLLIPGWGQRYTKQKTKGFIFTSLTVVSAVALLMADNDFNDKYDDYTALLERYDSETSIETRQALYPSLMNAQDQAYDAENYRTITAGTLIGIWGLNVIDALFFYPDRRGGVILKELTIQPDLNPTRPGVKLSYNF